MNAAAFLLAAFVLLLSLSSFFSGSEVALFSLRRWRVERMKQEPGTAGPRVAALLAEPRRLLLTILIANETINILLANVGGELRARIGSALSQDSVAWTRPAAVLLTTLILVIFGEIVPKSLALASAERWALMASRPLALCGFLVAVPRWLLAVVLRLVVGEPKEKRMDAGDLKALIEEAQREGEVSPLERRRIDAAMALQEVPVGAIMTSRKEIRTLSMSATVEEATVFAVGHGYSRIPVHDPTAEDPGDIAGLVYAHDLLDIRYGLVPPRPLRSLVRAPLFVPETSRASDLLRELQAKRLQLAVVVDEYGVSSGIVTMDDLLSEIVGEIADSFRRDTDEIVPIAAGSFRVLGRTPLHDLSAELGAEFRQPGCYTVAGLLSALCGHLPREGETIETGGFLFRVERATRTSVESVTVSRREAAS